MYCRWKSHVRFRLFILPGVATSMRFKAYISTVIWICCSEARSWINMRKRHMSRWAQLSNSRQTHPIQMFWTFASFARSESSCRRKKKNVWNKGIAASKPFGSTSWRPDIGQISRASTSVIVMCSYANNLVGEFQRVCVKQFDCRRAGRRKGPKCTNKTSVLTILESIYLDISVRKSY